MWFQALISLILAGFFGWILPEPFNLLSVIAGLWLFFWTLYHDAGESHAAPTELPWGRHPYYQQSHVQRAKPAYVEFKRVERLATASPHEPLGSKESLKMNILYKENANGHKICMRCGTYVFAGFVLPRVEQRERSETDAYFFCFGCRNAIADNDQLVKIAKERMTNELEGKFDLHLDERDVMILDAVMHHFQMGSFKELDLKQYAQRFFCLESDVLNVERKIHLFAEALRSSHPKIVEPTSDEVANWMGM